MFFDVFVFVFILSLILFILIYENWFDLVNLMIKFFINFVSIAFVSLNNVVTLNIFVNFFLLIFIVFVFVIIYDLKFVNNNEYVIFLSIWFVISVVIVFDCSNK